MRQIIDLRGGLALPCILFISISVVTGCALSGRTGAEWVVTEAEEHERCLKPRLQVLPGPAPNGSNKIWTNDPLY